MASKQIRHQKAVIFIFQLLFCQFLFAQSEPQVLMPEQDSIPFKKYTLFDNLSGVQLLYPGEYRFSNPQNSAFRNIQPEFEFGKESLSQPFSISQKKFESVLPGLGSIEHFSNQFRWNAGKRVAVDFGAGLVLQNTVMNPDILNYQVSFRAAIEYSFNDWLSAYIYGQYITKPINKPDDYFDPFMHSNPLFLQNEIGAGVKANFKKTYIGFEVYSLPGQEFKSDWLKPTNSRITIGF
jgi:hypothetical protein